MEIQNKRQSAFGPAGHFPLVERAIQVLRKLGLWNLHPDEPMSVRAYVMLVLYPIAWIIPSCVFIAGAHDGITLMLKAAAEQIVFFTIWYKLCSYTYNFRRWESIFCELQDAFDSVQNDPDMNVQRVLAQVLRFSHYLTRYYCSILMFNCSLYGLFPMVFVVVQYAVTGVYSVPLPTPIEGNYFIPGHRSNFWIWLPLASFLNVVLSLQGMGLFLMEVLVWSMIYGNASLFRILSIKASVLGAADKGKDQSWVADLQRFVSLHNCALRTAAILEDTLAGQMLFLYLSTIVSLCLMMVVITVAFKSIYLLVTMVCVIGYCLFQTFCFSMLGNELLEESEAVADVIFHSPWYNRVTREQRDLAFILLRAQRPVKLTAAKLFIVTRVSFMQVLKQAYTMFTLMSQVLGDAISE